MDFQNIIFEKIKQNVGILMINRPESLNSLNIKTLQEVDTCLDYYGTDIRFLLIKGSGTKAFIAGADIKEMNSLSENDFCDFLKLGQSITLKIEAGNFMSIANVNGYALGGGFEIALACDFIFASENARFGFPEVKLGIIPGFGGNVRISRRVGLHIAKELVLSGRIFDSNQAKTFGFINGIISSEKMEQEVFSFIEQLSENSFHAMLTAKSLHNRLFYSDINLLLKDELMNCSQCFNAKDRTEGMNAFIEKRKPNF